MSLLATLAFLDGQSAAEIVAAPRYHQQYIPDAVQYEAGAFTDDEARALAGQGDLLEPAAYRWGNFQAVTWDRATGKVEAASDPRGEGAGTVE